MDRSVWDGGKASWEGEARGRGLRGWGEGKEARMDILEWRGER